MTSKPLIAIGIVAVALALVFLPGKHKQDSPESPAKEAQSKQNSPQPAQTPTPVVQNRRPAPAPTREDLLARVKLYYDALSSKKFDDVWTQFLGSAMKQDTPREEYQRFLSSSVGRGDVSVAGATEASIGTTGEERRPLGHSVTPLRVKTEYGSFDAIHSTDWVVEEPIKGKPIWVLARDALRTLGKGKAGL